MVYVRKIEPTAIEWSGFSWSAGSFDTARRSYTELVEGTICTPNHLFLVTLNGGAERLEVEAACGHRYAGDEKTGAVSFVPAGCERRLRLLGVKSRWASISLRPTIFTDEIFEHTSLEAATFTNREEPFIAGLIAEFARLHATEGKLENTYCDAMTWALAHYLVRRFGQVSGCNEKVWKLPPWRLRRIADYVDAHIDRELCIAELADEVGLSCGHLDRSFRATTGKTPLEFINERRIRHAIRLLENEDMAVTAISLRCGFQSPSHFARVFRRITGRNPSTYREGSAAASPYAR